MRQEYPTEVRKWDIFEVALEGPEGEADNFKGIFSNKNESVVVDGFYDGDGVYKIRFMPSYEGRYTFILKGGFLENNLSGVFYATEADENSHGLVRVNGTHFAYEDGTPFNCFATTSNVWHLQDADTIEETIRFLKESAVFNKVRFNILPYDNENGYPYTIVDNKFASFDTTYFQKLERAIKKLADIGVEADLVFFTASDYLWQDNKYTFEEAKALVAYTVNRLSACHNIWWSLANDYDAIPLSSKEWIDLANTIIANDPYGHLRSIENSKVIYDYHRNWTTHCSIKQIDCYKGCEDTDEIIARFNKPVVYEDFGFEGNMEYGWGNLTKAEALRRVWETTLRGGYPSYSEARSVNDKEWWLHGGKINSANVENIKLLKSYIGDSDGLTFYPYSWDELCAIKSNEEELDVKSEYLFYYSFMAPGKRTYYIDDETDYLVEVIDTVNAEVYKQGIHRGEFEIELPEKPYVAVRLSLPKEEEEEVEVEPYEDVKKEVFEDVIPEEELDEEPTLVEEELEVEEVSEAEEEEKEENLEDAMAVTPLFSHEEELTVFDDDELEDADEFELSEDTAELETQEDAWDEMFDTAPTEVIKVNEETYLLEDTDDDIFGSATPKQNEEVEADDHTLELPIAAREEFEDEELPEIVTGAIPVIKDKNVGEEELEDLRREPMFTPDVEEPHIPSIEETLNIMFMNRNKKEDE